VPRHWSPTTTEVPSVDVVCAVVRGLDGEANPLDHRLEEPGEGAVLVADMFFEFGSEPAFVSPSLFRIALRIARPP
jgi:hypothetical protein